MNALIRQSILNMTGYVPGEQPKDGFIKLNTNENPYPPSPRVERVLATLAAGSLRLYPDPVCTTLREKIAAMHGCDASHVFVGNGSDEILALCTRAFVENDGSIGYLNPSYTLYPVLADSRGVARKPITLGKHFEWTVPEGYTCSLFFLTSPHAPTGILFSKPFVKDFCREFSGVVVIDEAYADFAAENSMDLALELDMVLVTRTLSKSYSLAGLRVGYAVGPVDFIETLFKIKDAYNLDAVSQELALAALSDMDHMRENVEKIKATRERLSHALTDIGYTVYPSEANFILVRPTGLHAKDLFERLKKKHILVRYFPGERSDDCVRITVGTDAEIDKLIEACRGVI